MTLTIIHEHVKVHEKVEQKLCSQNRNGNGEVVIKKNVGNHIALYTRSISIIIHVSP